MKSHCRKLSEILRLVPAHFHDCKIATKLYSQPLLLRIISKDKMQKSGRLYMN